MHHTCILHHAHKYACTDTHTRTQGYTHTHHTHIHTHAHTHTDRQTDTHAHAHTHMHTYTPMHMCTPIDGERNTILKHITYLFMHPLHTHVIVPLTGLCWILCKFN